MIASRRDYAPYAELTTEVATDMYTGGLPVTGNWVQFSVDETDESVQDREIGEWNEKRRVEYATREEGGIEFSGYTAVTNFQHVTSNSYYIWENPASLVEFRWTGTPGVPANLQAETFDVGVPYPSGEAIGAAREDIAMPGEEVSAATRVLTSAKTGRQEARQSMTQTENAGESHEARVAISSFQRQIVRTGRATGEVDEKALGNLTLEGVTSPYFDVDIGVLEPGTVLGEEVLGAGVTPVTLEWAKETGTLSSPSARFDVGGVSKQVPNWYYEQVGKRSPTVSGVLCQCSARVADTTLGVIMYCPNSDTEEKSGGTAQGILGPGTIQYGWGVPEYKYSEGEEPTSVDGAVLLGREKVDSVWEDENARWWKGGDWQTLREIISVGGATGNIALPASLSKYTGSAISFSSTTWMRYHFPYEDGGGVHEFKVGPVACYESSYSTGRINAYTIAQAGNTAETGDGTQLLRQAKEVFPARILRISAHTETDEGCRSMNGLSTSNLNAEYTESGLEERSISAIPRALLTTTHDCSSRLMASFAADTNVSQYLSLPSAVSASVIHDDGGSASASLRLAGWGSDETQDWPGKDFGYSLTSSQMEYTNSSGTEYPFSGVMNTLTRYNSQDDEKVSLGQLPTYVTRGAVKNSSRSTLFSQTAYLLDDVSGNRE